MGVFHECLQFISLSSMYNIALSAAQLTRLILPGVSLKFSTSVILILQRKQDSKNQRYTIPCVHKVIICKVQNNKNS